MNEFDLIAHYFSHTESHRPDVSLGIGDDAALCQVPPGYELAITTDSLVADIHFPATTPPAAIGHKALAVNLSDLAAMGATPAWVTLAITLPEINTAWLQAFCDGFFTLAKRYKVQLIGGDTTRGPLSMTVQAMGLVPHHQALLRSHAKAGDDIYVTGNLGDAGLALAVLQQRKALSADDLSEILPRLYRPEPRIEAGLMLRPLAHAAIDISDGLAADLSHLLKASRVGAVIHVNDLPLSDILRRTLTHQEALDFALTAGDDYELCFTAPSQQRLALQTAFSKIRCALTRIGTVTEEQVLHLIDQNGQPYHGTHQGFLHFK